MRRHPHDAVNHGFIDAHGHLHRVTGGKRDIDHVGTGEVVIAGGPRTHARHQWTGGLTQGLRTVEAGGVVKQLPPRVEDETTMSLRGGRGDHGGLGLSASFPVTQLEPGLMGLADGAHSQRGAHRVGQCCQHADLVHRGARLLVDDTYPAGAVLPVEEGSGGLLQQAHREDDVGAFGDLAATLLQTDDESSRVERLSGSLWIGQVGQLDAGDHDRLHGAIGQPVKYLGGGASRLVGQRLDSPCSCDVHPGLDVGDRTSTGQQGGQTASLHGTDLTGAARHPGHPGVAGTAQVDDGGECSWCSRGTLTDEDDGVLVNGPLLGKAYQRRGLVPGSGRHQGGTELAGTPAEMAAHGEHRQLHLAPRLAQTQEDHRALVLGFEVHQDDLAGLLQVYIGHRLLHRCPGNLAGEEGILLGAGGASPEVDVVGAQHGACETRPGQVRLDGEASTGEHTGRPCPRQSGDGGVDGLGPGGRLQCTVPAHHRSGDAVITTRREETEPAAVTVPLLVDLGAVSGVATLDLVVPVIGAQLAAGRTVLARRRRGDEVERAAAEPVLGAGERSHRADLDDVAREVRVVGGLGVRPDLGDGTALQQMDERVTGDLVGEPGAALAQHAPLPVQQDLGRDVDGLGVGAFDAFVP